MSLMTMLRRRGGPAPFDIAAWFAPYVGDYWLAHDLTRAAQQTDGSGVITDGEVVGFWRGQRDTYTVTQGSYGAKFIYSDAEKAMELSDYREMTATSGIDYILTGEPASVFIFARASGTVNSGNEMLVKTYEASPATNMLHLSPFGGGSSPRSKAQFAVGGTSDFDSSAPGVTEPTPVTDYRAVSYVLGPVAHRGPFYNDDAVPAANTSGWVDLYPSSDSGQVYFRAPAVPPAVYYVKMILLIRKALTLEDRTNLLAYARALP